MKGEIHDHGGDDLVVLKSVEKLFSLVKSEFYGKYGEEIGRASCRERV